LNSTIPAYPTPDNYHQDDLDFIKDLMGEFHQFIDLMEKVKIKEALKIAM
jgi:hypothetical protein